MRELRLGANATRAFGNFSLVSDIVGSGAYAARFDLQADSTHLTRCQVITVGPSTRAATTTTR